MPIPPELLLRVIGGFPKLERQDNDTPHIVMELLDRFKEQMTDNEYVEACNTLKKIHEIEMNDLQLRCLSMERERAEFIKYIDELEDEKYNVEHELYDKNILIEEMRKKLHELQKQLTPSIYEPSTKPQNPKEDNPLYYTCDCGSCIQKIYQQRHEKSKKHITFMNKQKKLAKR